jgi:adenine-specific DNA-methyltransferase
MLKFLGSKARLLPHITQVAQSLGARSALDAFAGSCRVGVALKKAGLDVTSNDILTFPTVVGNCYIGTDAQAVCRQTYLDEYFEVINSLAPEPGYLTQKFSVEARYFQEHNAARADAILCRIRTDLFPNTWMKDVLLTSLMEALDSVDSTVGLQMAYLKTWAARSYKSMVLEMPTLLPGPGSVSQMDAHDALASYDGDLAYLDPPYNQHSYLGNYHVWETIAKGDTPETYGIANKRVDVKTRKSAYNSKREIRHAFTELVVSSRVPYLLVSFNNEGYLGVEDIESILGQKGYVGKVAIPHRRYVGHKIGCYNPAGEKVGVEGPSDNTEYLFLVGQNQSKVLDSLACLPL